MLAFARTVVWASLLAVLGAARPAPAQQLPFLTGGDISLLTFEEQHGVIYKDGGKPQDPLKIFGAYGMNCMRLRIWVNPSHQGIFVNDLPYTIALGRRIKQAGMKLLLDFHYSDTWADPGHQPIPAAWKDLPFDALEQQVRTYSRAVIVAMRKADALPDIVQVGNEITAGMMWPPGKLYKSGGGAIEGAWERLGRLVKAGIAGVKEGAAPGPQPVIMIHIDRGGDASGTQWFFDHLLQQGVEFDVIGESFYPQFHGPMSGLVRTLNETARRYHKPIVVVEAGYPYSGRPGSSSAFTYPVSPSGQRRFLIDLVSAVKQTPEGLGRGVIWWAPEWIPPKGGGEGWGPTLFDLDGNALPGLPALAGLLDPNTPYRLVESSAEAPLRGGATGASLSDADAPSGTQWSIRPVGDEGFHLVELESGKLLTAHGGAVALTNSPSDSGALWEIVDVGDGRFRFVNKASGRALAASGSSVAVLSQPPAHAGEWRIAPLP